MIEKVGVEKVVAVSKAKPIKRNKQVKSRNGVSDKPEQLEDSAFESKRVGSRVDERC